MPNNKYAIPEFKTISDLADFLDAMPAADPEAKIGFDMGQSAANRDYTMKHPCGTACCIGGLVSLSLGREYSHRPAEDFRKAFDVSADVAQDICYPPTYLAGWNATPQQAASLLRHYVETGEVDWDRATCVKKETADA